MNIQVIVDTSFRRRFGDVNNFGPGTEIDKRIAAVFAHAQAYWFASNSLKTGVRLNFRFAPTAAYFKDLTASDESMRWYVTDIDTNHWICFILTVLQASTFY